MEYMVKNWEWNSHPLKKKVFSAPVSLNSCIFTLTDKAATIWCNIFWLSHRSCSCPPDISFIPSFLCNLSSTLALEVEGPPKQWFLSVNYTAPYPRRRQYSGIQLITKFNAYAESKASWSLSLTPITGPYPEPNESNSHPHMVNSEIHLILSLQSSNLEVPPKTANSHFPLPARVKYMNAVFLHKAKLAGKQTSWWTVCIFCFKYTTLPSAGNMDVILQKDCAIYNGTRKFHVNPANRHYSVGSTSGLILPSPLQPMFLYFKRYSINVALRSSSANNTKLTWNTLLLWPLS